jgi:hypothetical protein
MAPIPAESSLAGLGPAERYGLVLEEGEVADAGVLELEDIRRLSGERGEASGFELALAVAMIAGCATVASRLVQWLTT